MFGKTLLLLGFCIYIIRLYLENTITLYIHPRYASFSFIMSGIALLLLIIGLAIEYKHRHRSRFVFARPKFNFVNIIVVLVLGLAFVLPAQPLSKKTIGRKSLITPTYDKRDDNCPTDKIEAIQDWVYEISEHSLHCFTGKPITINAFVFDPAEVPLPQDTYYVGRVVISCCIVDASRYAIPVRSTTIKDFPKDTLLRVEGVLKPMQINGTTQLVIMPKHITKANKSNQTQPYEYLNSQPTDPVQPLQPTQ